MTDVMTPKQRSKCMSRIMSKWTKQEKVVHNYLKGRKIRHKMHPPIEGNPDLLLKDTKTVVFLDGCFWHKCPKCFQEPSTNRDFWLPKIEKTVRRDKETTKKLKKVGWNVIRLWEHKIKEEPESCLKMIESAANNFIEDDPK